MADIHIDTYYDITCNNCGRSWSTDFNGYDRKMSDDGGMGMAKDKQWLRKVATRTGWRYRNGMTLCPECVEKVNRV